MAVVTKEKKLIGYLPNDVPPIGQAILLGFQHVAGGASRRLRRGHGVGRLWSGDHHRVDPLPRHRWQVHPPLLRLQLLLHRCYYGSHGSDERYFRPVPGCRGVVNILVGFGIRWIGKGNLDKILPPVITGSVATVIGIALAYAALDMASAHWGVALITLLITVLFSVYLQGKGFIGLLPVLLGGIAGYIISIPFGLVDFSSVMTEAWFRIPHFTLPAFGNPKAWGAVGTIAVIAIATIPESTAHLYQISLYVDELATRMKRERYHLSELIGLNLILDGLGDFINGMFGGVAGTNYGENNSLMVITRNYSGPALIVGGAIAILLGFVGKLAALVGTIPLAVTGGLAIYLFGVIGMQGVALMMAEKVNLYDPKQLAIGAAILVIGIGGHIGYGGNLPISILPGIFPDGLPAIATAAVVGIVLNLIFLIFKAPEVPVVTESSE